MSQPETAIHPTAIVDPHARLGARVRIGAYTVVGGGAVLGDDVELGHHVVLEGRVELASGVRIGHGSILGGIPQDLKFKATTPSGVRVGAGTVLREHVTVHRATAAEGWTEIGRDCLLMGLCHVAHDCRLGDAVIVINYAGITGHCQIGDRATIGGLTGMVPFTRIGTCAYVGGMAKVNADVPPYMIVDGQPVNVLLFANTRPEWEQMRGAIFERFGKPEVLSYEGEKLPPLQSQNMQSTTADQKEVAL